MMAPEEQPPSEEAREESPASQSHGLFGCCGKNNEINLDEPIPPMRYKSQEPEADANFVSRLFFMWIQPLFTRASFLHKRHKALQQDDLVPLSHMDMGDVVSNKFEETWFSFANVPLPTDEKEKKAVLERRFRKSLLSVMGRRLLVAAIVKFFNTALQFTFPLLLNAILVFVEKTTQGVDVRSKNDGYFLSVALLLAMAAKAVTENAYFQLVNRCGFQSKAAISAAVYKKSLRLAASERGTTTLGELLNLMQVDAEKIELFMPQVNVLWDGAFQIIGYMTILYTLIGPACFVGLAVMAVAGPVQGQIMKRLFGLNRKMVIYTDSRVKTINEALQGVRSVKMYTWEGSFQRIISQARGEELTFLRRISYLRGFSRAYMGALPGIVAVVSFAVFARAVGGVPQASTLFAALVAFEQLRFPLLFYPMALALYAQAKVSSGRLALFLGLREVNLEDGRYCREGATDKTPVGEKRKGEIIVDNVEVYWNDPTLKQSEGTNDDDKSVASSLDDDKSTVTAGDKSASDATEASEAPIKGTTKPVLREVSLHVSPGELCAVVGRVGSGKSSLCSAILNETVLEQGRIELKGSVAYAAQSAWILNATVRDNILFGLAFDQKRYDAVIKACQLTHDLSLLDNGDLTEIGENGINLSGGQKQRISVARVAYADADVVIMDDPLSALDPEVGLRLFDECILGLMKEKTRLLVTNQLQCLQSCDSVVSLGKGRVLEQGTYEDLMSNQSGAVQRLIKELKGAEPKKQGTKEQVTPAGVLESEASLDDTAHGETPEAGKAENIEKGEAKLTTQEERSIGAVKPAIYKAYINAGGGFLLFGFVFFFFILCTASQLFTTTWISIWTSDATYIRHPLSFYLGIYAAIAIALGFFTFARSFLLARFGVRASGKLHRDLLMSILRAPMIFYDTTPMGRILSRFSKDFYSIDVELADYLDFFLFGTLFVLTSLGAIIYATPIFAAALVPVIFVYFRTLNYFREVSRETKRLDSISRSPVYSQFSETLGGLTTIRAYSQTARFITDFLLRVNQNTRASYNNKTADRWLSVRLELVGALIAGLAAVFAIRVALSQAGTGGNYASIAGLSLNYAISVTGLLNWCVRSFAQLENAMNACERVLYYTNHIPHEAPATADDLEKHAVSMSPPPTPKDASNFAVVASGGKAIRTEQEWPTQGGIDLNNLVMRYREGTPVVIKGLTVSIKGGERVGVVGRTGSGKSSLLLCLLRIVEPELTCENASDYQAPISIDGVDVLRIGLDDLRTKLGIIPQNPVLFSGTVRSNMDPFDEYSDDAIWSALERCGMKSAVEEMPGELSGQVAEYGENLSQGQRQLLCLGRALLKQCRILLLDEATSSVDFETDREIQKTLRTSFAGCTVLTIAHRINTIMDSDKILVMQDGKAAEFAPPQELLENGDSVFSEIVKDCKVGSH